MASSFTIPTTTVSVGAHNLPASGGASVPDADHSIQLVIDRTVTNGFNSQAATTTMNVLIAQSNDSGTTWVQLAAMGPVVGGSNISSKTGSLITQDTLFTQFNPGTSRLARITVTVAGSSVAVAGTLTTA